METWVIITIVFIWFVLPALLIIAACIHASRQSQAEERHNFVEAVKELRLKENERESLRTPVRLRHD